MQVYWSTIKGTDKAGSEDRVLVGQRISFEETSQAVIDHGFVAVADGVGGNYGGADAASFVCQSVSNIDEPSKILFQRINHLLIEKSSSNYAYNMATTFSGIYMAPDKADLIVFHVGNTRIYAIQAGKYLRQITEDDTVVQHLIKTGKLTEEEAENYSARNEITACFGGGKETLLQMDEIHLRDKVPKQLLLTSDGIHEYLSIDEMETILAGVDDDKIKLVKTMVEQAIVNGSQDDCTAIFVDLGI
ncbi:PP2C family serine/threonine-protein phosphatase [uncultured Megasphaera sp.]|uniref:PP2C family protein-serine/threonine phosphatase n=1 Tax=uncultured Megasphaera sp. TaxID=165188 RepID=UPI0026060AC0|nr:PP2C family serine/threonine-protein phosphatase [uncultured Megasphaera sp.]